MYPNGDPRDAVGYPLSPPMFGPRGFGQYGAPLVVRPPYGVAGARPTPGGHATGYMPMAVLVPWDLWALYGGLP